MSIVIAVDGTAASGKGTLAKKLAAYFGFAHMDSGALYRLTALGVIEGHGDPANELDALKAAQNIDVRRTDDLALRSSEVGRLSSVVAVFPAVREAILGIQRGFAEHPPGNASGAVIDGRDIGTFVCPNADAKFFIDADPNVRAHRRWLELRATGAQLDESALVAEIKQRDERDQTRAASPLRPAPDAKKIDTTHLTVDQMFDIGLEFTLSKLASRKDVII